MAIFNRTNIDGNKLRLLSTSVDAFGKKPGFFIFTSDIGC